MSSGLHVHLDRIGRLIDEAFAKHDPLPRDVAEPLGRAYDEILRARGKDPGKSRSKTIVGRFDVGDSVCMIVQSYTQGTAESSASPGGMSLPSVIGGTVIKPPVNPNVSDYEMLDGKPWYFTSELPVTTVSAIDAKMHVELASDRREMFHLEGQHWSTWHEKNGPFWSLLTVFPEI